MKLLEESAFTEIKRPSDLLPAEVALCFYHDACKRAGVTKERPDFLDHSRKTSDCIRIYSDGGIAPAVYYAALMHDLPSRFYAGDATDLRRGPAAAALIEFYTNPIVTDRTRRFVFSLLADLPSIERGAELCRDYDENPPELQEVMRGERTGRIAADDPLWRAEAKIGQVSRFIINLRQQAEGHNVEAVQIKAAEAIANLQCPAPDDTALLRDIIEAETFYAPLCEVWGLDAMAMSLRSEATKLRYRKMGMQYLVDKATDLRSEVLQTNIVEDLPRMLGAERIEFEYAPNAATTDPYREVSMYYAGVIVGGPLDGRSIRMRLKSIGSITKKIHKDPEQRLPLDLFAITIIADSHEQNAIDFVDVIQRIESDDAYSLRAAPSKELAMATQGSEEYMQSMQEAANAVGLKLEPVYETYTDCKGKEKRRTKEYHVTKCTGVYETTKHSAPFEIQFLDAKNRKDARISEQAHIIFKLIRDSGLELSPEDKLQIRDVLSATYDRMSHVDKTAKYINKRSEERTAQLLQDLGIFLMTQH